MNGNESCNGLADRGLAAGDYGVEAGFVGGGFCMDA